jgi:hypothetical protein
MDIGMSLLVFNLMMTALSQRGEAPAGAVATEGAAQ